jgi:hypothetical protein
MLHPHCQSDGFSEAIISVSDLESWVSFLESVFRWDVIARGRSGDDLHRYWGLPHSTQSEFVLMGEPSARTDLGRIRLMKFEGVRQIQARPNAYAWDAGGFFDLHVQVHDVHGLFNDMQKRGWRGYTEPQRLDVGGVLIDEVLMQGPDSVSFALIERVSPPFQIVDGYERVSPAWNAPQMVQDFAAAHRYYADGLGFIPTIELEMPPAETGENLFGLPASLARSTSTSLAFFHPKGERGAIGSVDILCLNGVEGRHLGDRTHVPNLGLCLLRYEVSGLDEYIQAISDSGLPIRSGLATVDILPYGKCKMASVSSPEGAVIDFFERTNA